MDAEKDAPGSLPEDEELASFHLDCELAVGLWASHAQGGRPPKKNLPVLGTKTKPESPEPELTPDTSLKLEEARQIP